MTRPFAALLACALAVAPAGASPAGASPAGGPDTAAARIARALLSARPLADPPALRAGEGPAVGARVRRLLAGRLGPVVGYKAALTSHAARARLGARQPLLGFLLRGMLLAGPRAAIRLGAQPPLLVEADLLVRVGDAAIDTARADTELAAALDAVIAFVEVPALPYAPAVRLDAELLAAANAGAWLGVTGPAVPLRGTPGERLRRLGAVRVHARDAATGRALGAAGAAALMGHPIHVVRWLRDRLRAEGVRLRAGDLLSLGSLTPPVRARAGLVYEARYEGLGPGGPVTVRVRFLP